MDDLVTMSAVEIVQLLKEKSISPKELIRTAASRINEVDFRVNAIPTRCYERAAEKADALDFDKAKDRPGFLYGLPIAVKDTAPVQGVRTTYGSRVFADHVPDQSDFFVKTLEKNGALVVGKSNAPEFGAGANTFNEVFGQTRNPWSIDLTSGGSSGGSAAALATGQVWLATGSDLGGSLRIPASFCSVVGFRPSPGRVARGPAMMPFETLSVAGPMARTVSDVALMMDAMTGQNPEDPLCLPPPSRSWSDAAASCKMPERVAYSTNLNGLVPTDKQIADLCAALVERLEEEGAIVEEKCPDFRGMKEVIFILRDIWSALPIKEQVKDKCTLLKEEILSSIDKGMKRSSSDLVKAEIARGEMYRRVARFFQEVDILLVPTTITPPFDANTRFLTEFNGKAFENYTEWFLITYYFSLTACPVLSLPVGFASGGLPVGVQVIGAPFQDAKVLSAARFLEQLLGLETTPIDPVAPRAR